MESTGSQKIVLGNTNLNVFTRQVVVREDHMKNEVGKKLMVGASLMST